MTFKFALECFLALSAAVHIVMFVLTGEHHDIMGCYLAGSAVVHIVGFALTVRGGHQTAAHPKEEAEAEWSLDD